MARRIAKTLRRHTNGVAREHGEAADGRDPGGTLLVKWKVTIPHDADRLGHGRAARPPLQRDRLLRARAPRAGGRRPRFPLPARPRRPHHRPHHTHTRAQVLKGCVEGDGNCFQDDDGIPGKDNAVDAGDGTVEMSQLLTLPAGKTCSYCVLQWMWAARQDGGFYIGCADIAITEDGNLPDYAQVPSGGGRRAAGRLGARRQRDPAVGVDRVHRRRGDGPAEVPRPPAGLRHRGGVCRRRRCR